MDKRASTSLKRADIHRLRYYRHRIVKVPIAQIASEQGVKEDTILKSIELIEQYNAAVNPEVMLQSVASTVIALAPLHRAALESGMTATKVVRDAKGTPIRGTAEPDYEVQMKASELYNDLVKAGAPKTGISVGVGVNVNAGGGGGGSLGLTTYEDKMREIQRRRMEQRAIPAVAESLGEDFTQEEVADPIAIPIHAQPPRSTD